MILIGLLAAVHALPVFRGTYGSNASEHYRFGLEMGSMFKDSIAARIDLTSPQVPEKWVTRHTARYPMYMEEIRGLAHGANQTFETMLALNFKEELSMSSADHCSDVIVPGVALAHNEDGSSTDFGNTFVAEVTIDGQSWAAYNYAGEICSGAFGWTPNFAFTLNYVQPAEFDDMGFGRGFVSRDLLSATTSDQALDVIRLTRMIAGHNYQLVEWDTGTISNVEAAAFNEGVVTTPTAPFFHANEYDALLIDQVVGESTLRRTVRATKQIPPAVTAAMALDVLSDTRDVDGSGDYPIYRKTATLATALFNIANASLTIFEGPANQFNVVYGPTDARTFL